MTHFFFGLCFHRQTVDVASHSRPGCSMGREYLNIVIPQSKEKMILWLCEHQSQTNNLTT